MLGWTADRARDGVNAMGQTGQKVGETIGLINQSFE